MPKIRGFTLVFLDTSIERLGLSFSSGALIKVPKLREDLTRQRVFDQKGNLDCRA